MTAPTRISASRFVLWLALAVACGLAACEIPFRGIDPDEFEHLHAAWLVARGDVPYRDFFEHHGPLLYYLIRPLFHLCGPEISVLWWARAAMGLCSLGTLALTARIAGRLGGPSAGLIAATLLAWSSVFHAKGIELRPDVPAALLLAGCFALSLEPQFAWRRWLVVGLLAGLATLFTQKSIVIVAGLTLAAALRDRRALGWPGAVRISLAVAAGGAAVWGIAFAAFSSAGAAADFWHGAVVQLLIWPVRSRRWDQLRPTLLAELTLWVSGCAGVAAAFRDSLRKPGGCTERILVSIAAGFALLSLAWVKATYSQYYLLWIPLLAALAAERLTVWSAGPDDARRVRLARAVGCLVVFVEAALWWRAMSLGPDGPLPHLSGELARIASPPFLAWSILLPAALTGIGLMAGHWRWATFVGAIAAVGMFHAVTRDVDFACWHNDEQVASLALVRQMAGTEGTVLDGFSGFGALNRHAYYYWWLNEYSLALMTPADREGRLLDALERSPPTVVIQDRHLDLLPETVTGWIRERYEPLPDHDWLWRRRP